MTYRSIHPLKIRFFTLLLILSFGQPFLPTAAYAQVTSYEWLDSLSIYPDDYDTFGNIWGFVQVGDHQLPDGNLYEVSVCRVTAWGDGYHVGKVMLGDWRCWVSWGGAEHTFTYGDYEILADTNGLGYDWVDIKELTNRQIIRYGVQGGHVTMNSRRKIEYICAHFGANGWDVGKYIEGICYIPYGGQEWAYSGSDFAILMSYALPGSSVAAPLPRTPSSGSVPAAPPSALSDSAAPIIAAIRTNRSAIANNYPTQAEQLAHALVTHLSDFRAAGQSPERMSSIINTDDAAMRMIAATNAVWGDWDVNLCQKYGWNLYSEDPAGKVRPFRQLIIRLIQGRQGTLSEAEQRALESYFIRSEDADAWRNNMDAIIGAINKSFFP